MWIMCLFFCGIPHVTYLHEKLVSLPHSAGLHSLHTKLLWAKNYMYFGFGLDTLPDRVITGGGCAGCAAGC